MNTYAQPLQQCSFSRSKSPRVMQTTDNLLRHNPFLSPILVLDPTRISKSSKPRQKIRSSLFFENKKPSTTQRKNEQEKKNKKLEKTPKNSHTAAPITLLTMPHEPINPASPRSTQPTEREKKPTNSCIVIPIK